MVKKFTIIIPVYNAEKYLRECLDSVLRQKYLDFEIIIIDDGSDDNSWGIIEEYTNKDERIIAIHQENQGVSSARNAGLNRAQGQYILFVDSDDSVSENLLYLLNEHIVESNPDIIEYSVYKTNSDGVIYQKKLLYDNFYQNNEDCLSYYYTSKNSLDYCCNKVFRFEPIQDLRFKQFSQSEDYIFNVESFLRANSIKTISDCLYYYRNHEASTVNRPFNERKLDTIRAGKYVFDFVLRPEYKLYASVYILYHCTILYMLITNANSIYKEKYLPYILTTYKTNYIQIIQNPTYKQLLISYKIKFFIFKVSPQLYNIIRTLDKKFLNKEIRLDK